MLIMAALAASGILTLSATAITSAPDPASVDELMAGVLKAASLQQQRLGPYSVIRQYTVRNGHLKKDAVLRVRWTYRPDRGKRFEVISNDGVSGLVRRSLMKVWEAEAENSRSKTDLSRISPDHYMFRLVNGTLDRCKVQLIPRQKSKYLLNGFASLAGPDWAIVRVEGKTPKRLSFWVGEAEIVQNFAQYGGFWLPSKMYFRAKIRFVGETELTVESEDYVLGDSAKVRYR